MIGTEEVHAEIRNVLYNYSRAIDTKDWVLLQSLFTTDCEMVSPGWTVSGSEALAEHMRVLHSPLDGSIHSVTNIQIEVEGGLATVRSYLDALLVRTGGVAGDTLKVAGTYLDMLKHSGAEWQIQRRAFTPLLRDGNVGILGSRIG